MKGGEWIEQIRVRSTAATLGSALPDLRRQVDAIDASLPSVEPFFLQHALYEGDLAVVLVWRPEVAPEKTREGLMIAEQLALLGSVDHAVWVPAEK